MRNNSKTGLFPAMKRTGSILLAGSLFAAALLAVLTASLEARAQDSFFAYTNPDTNYVVYMNDEYDLLSDEEESKLINEMIPLTEYGNAGFLSCENSSESTSPTGIFTVPSNRLSTNSTTIPARSSNSFTMTLRFISADSRI